MDHPLPSLLDIVQKHVHPEQYAALHWEGSFRDYLGIAEKNPAVARNAWQRLLDMIELHGYEQPARRGAPPRWKIFDGALNADILIDVLKRLVRDAGREVYLILDNVRVRCSKPVKAWLAALRTRTRSRSSPCPATAPN